MAQSGRNMVFDPARPISERRLIHRRRAIAGAHRCLHRGIQRDRRAIRLDQEEGLPAAVQKPLYHPTLIPGTSYRTAGALTPISIKHSARHCFQDTAATRPPLATYFVVAELQNC